MEQQTASATAAAAAAAAAKVQTAGGFPNSDAVHQSQHKNGTKNDAHAPPQLLLLFLRLSSVTSHKQSQAFPTVQVECSVDP